MNRKPLFITLVVALAIIGIVAVVLFVKNKKAEPQPTPDEKETYLADAETAKPASPVKSVTINESLIKPANGTEE